MSNEKTFSDPAFFSMTVSMAYGTCLALAYPVSGGSLNPALGFNIALLNSWSGNNFNSAWVYLIVPFISALLIGLLFRFVIFKNVMKVDKSMDVEKILDQAALE